MSKKGVRADGGDLSAAATPGMSPDVLVTSPGRPARVFSVPQEQLSKPGSCAPVCSLGKWEANAKLRVPSAGGEDAGRDLAVRPLLVPGEPGLRAGALGPGPARGTRRDADRPAPPRLPSPPGLQWQHEGWALGTSLKLSLGICYSHEGPLPCPQTSRAKGKVSPGRPGTGVTEDLGCVTPQELCGLVAVLLEHTLPTWQSWDAHGRRAVTSLSGCCWGAGPLLSPNFLAQGALPTCDSQVPWPRACCKLS